ncbi:mechanosensitive ion channel family protein [Pedomonas mirosovicensis]|uniref:mechanosensitive ion channel family protein n=1 Tax=Pedomonas mirosovicensis TaxID=2908641 RepID=UPI00216A3899|nr:mechanosensitive ion channel family protein [Pedomonas mirosovicensis]MCH8685826.1 mechanosensitive ion channel family protein [Pedomonas mirosovicensis]
MFKTEFFEDAERLLRDQAVWWFTSQPIELLITLAIITLLTILLYSFLCAIGRRIKAQSNGDIHSWHAIIGRLVQMTRWWFLAALGLRAAIEVLRTPPFLARTIDVFFTIAFVLQVAIWLRYFILAVLTRKAYQHDDGVDTLASALSILRFLISLVIWFAAFIFILDNLGVEVTTLLAGLGIGGLAVGLAAQGIVSDLFAALTIIFDKPFKRGDFIVSGDTIGTVEDIGLKNVRIKALSGELLIVPNSKLLSELIHNYKGPFERRIEQRFTVAPDTDFQRLEQLTEDVREIIRTTPNCRLDRCHLLNMSLYGFEYEMIYFITTDDYNLYMDVRHAINTAILRKLAAEDIKLANVYIFQLPGAALPA